MVFSDLRKIKGIGPAYHQKITTIMVRDGLSLETVFGMSAEDIKKTFGIPINAARAISSTSSGKLERAQVMPRLPAPKKPPAIARSDFRLINLVDEDYPSRLRDRLDDKAPKQIYVWGNLALLNSPSVGFCGSREVTDKGLAVAEDISQQIAHLGWVVVSGHARGVDAKAHETALRHGTGTIIVLPQGINDFSLRSELKPYVTSDNTLIISEFVPAASWNVGYAMQRNATIIALSHVMVLVEARDSGGTYNAGKKALALDCPLFVIRFQDKLKSNIGNDYFLQHGAFELMKSRKTNRANIDDLKKKAEQIYEQGTQKQPEQLTLQLN